MTAPAVWQSCLDGVYDVFAQLSPKVWALIFHLEIVEHSFVIILCG